MTDVVGHKPYEDRVDTVGIGGGADFSRMRPVGLEPDPNTIGEQWQLS